MKNFKLKTMEMIRQIRDKHYLLLQEKSPTEKIAFYRQKAQQLLAEIKTMQKLNG